MTVIFLSPGLYNLVEFTEHVNSVPLRVLSTDLSMRTPGLTVDALLHASVLLHCTASGGIPGTEQLSNTILTPRDNIEHTDSFTSTLTVEITGYDKTGNYCCIASLAGSDRDMSDCIIVTVSGICISCDAWSH